MTSAGTNKAILFLAALALGLVIFSAVHLLTPQSPKDPIREPASALSSEEAAGPRVVSRIEGDRPETVRPRMEPILVPEPEPLDRMHEGIQARVIDGYSGEPVTHFSFWCCEASDGDVAQNMRADKVMAFRRPDGVLKILDLEAGEYSIAIRAMGFETYFRRGLEVPQKEPIEEFVLSRGTFIEGEVVSAEGIPAPELQVLLDVRLDSPEESPPFRRSSQTDAEGRFLFGGLPTGTYGLFVQSLRHPLAKVESIYLGKGSKVFKRLTLPPLADLLFCVTNDSGHALPDSSIKLFEEEGRASFSLLTDLYGRAECKNVPPGKYSLRIFKEGYPHYTEVDLEIHAGGGAIRLDRVLGAR